MCGQASGDGLWVEHLTGFAPSEVGKQPRSLASSERGLEPCGNQLVHPRGLRIYRRCVLSGG